MSYLERRTTMQSTGCVSSEGVNDSAGDDPKQTIHLFSLIVREKKKSVKMYSSSG